jgi:glyoxylase-like metal-dependent hydrolase (beta-lactamase superfamily II)
MSRQARASAAAFLRAYCQEEDGSVTVGAVEPATLGSDSVTTIALSMANCYLIHSATGFFMVDTGLPNRRADIDRAIATAGCHVGDLRLIILTHGDYDHAGNAAHLRKMHGAKIAMHPEDAPRVRLADWNHGFKQKPDRFLLPFRIMGALMKPGPFDTFEPDDALADGESLAPYGFAGEIVLLPCQTRGSIGVVTPTRDVFCGDLLANIFGGPGLEFFIDDLAAARGSLERLRALSARTIYPGHGKAFDFGRLRSG